MKMITLFLAIIISMTAFSAIEPQNRSTNIKIDGTADASTLEKEFINVINNEGATIAAGQIVVADLTADDGASVIIDTSASQTPLCIMVASCADNALCKCQTYGKMDAALFSSTGGAAVAGAPFFISTASAGYIGTGALGNTDIPGGIFYDSAASSASVEVFIKLK